MMFDVSSQQIQTDSDLVIKQTENQYQRREIKNFQFKTIIKQTTDDAAEYKKHDDKKSQLDR